MKNIAIFASGSGTNAENIINHFSNGKDARVVLVLSDKREAYVLKRAAKHDVESIFFERDNFYGSGRVLDTLIDHKVDFVVLAGFLLLVPENILKNFEGRIVNIHPALLPKYGGKGMYRDHVHEAVIANRESESGITIHHVNRQYDAGDIIFQAKCRVLPDDTPGSLAKRIHELEYACYPVVIEKLIKGEPVSSKM